ncbi:hypothetical protein LZ32DRAFT_317091 [Colletotrichum eremochloae]|nr:hypothetical protein LZ32DRAFT_317091 [Colletotrichum eremochloae]
MLRQDLAMRKQDQAMRLGCEEYQSADYASCGVFKLALVRATNGMQTPGMLLRLWHDPRDLMSRGGKLQHASSTSIRVAWGERRSRGILQVTDSLKVGLDNGIVVHGNCRVSEASRSMSLCVQPFQRWGLFVYKEVRPDVLLPECRSIHIGSGKNERAG